MHRRRRSIGLGVRLAIVFVGAPLVAFAVAALAGIGGLDRPAEGSTPLVAAQIDRDQRRSGGDEVAVIARRTALRARPDGRSRPLARVGRRTEFRSQRVLAVVDRRDDWLRVIAPELGNGNTGWVKAADTRAGVTRYRIRVRLSKRRIDVVRDGRVIRRVRTAVGQNTSPTPRGRFAVTDKVPFTDRRSPYGCCALALSARQENIPAGWTGGDRIAIHATPVRSSIGQSVTLGCMRVPTRDARWMMRKVPLGTQVSIRA
jgi:lipoprotein-anchoring transpeptidase ErfK/SrfK